MAREYKDSGIEWIGRIPKGWGVSQLKRFVCFQNGQDYKEIEVAEGFPVYGSGGIFAYASQYMYEGESILFGRKGTINKPLYINCKFWTVDTMYYTIPKKDVCAKFLYYAATTLPYDKYSTSTALPSMTQTVLGNLNIAIPPISEQQRIADYLDRKCAEIDSLVELQEQMIAQLTDYKQSVITEAVTKGLNPEAELVSSGIDWIDVIPKGWKAIPFKEIFRTGKGLSFTKADLVNEGIPVISYGQVHSKLNKGTRIDDELIRFIPNDIAEGGNLSRVHVGDFIFADTSEDLDGCGNCVYVDKEIGLYAGYHSVVAFSKRKESNTFLAYLFLTNCWRSQIRCRVSGIKVFSVSQSIIKQTTLILPPYEEQCAIASYLDTKCHEIDTLISIKQQKIETLKEYKKSIIFEAVTGKAY